MLRPDDLSAYFQRLGLSERARAAINQIRSCGPSRRVGGGRENVAGRYPSRKMGVTIQFESHRVELAGIYEMEHDECVLEYYDQPPTIKLDYESANGKRLGVYHTPDFFVLRNTEAGWEEWKTEEELKRLSERNPNRYCSGDNGAWLCPPGSRYAEDLGLYYRVKFVTYSGTMQETCLRLMGKKMLVALMMEGKFSGEGLQALDTDEDLMSAMARELVEKAGVGESADALWRELDHEREKVLPRPAAAELEPEEEFAAALDLPVVTTTDPAPAPFGIRLLEPSLSTKKRKKPALWPTAREESAQLSLFG